ncbi:hypothetical protein K1T71_009760 [Dendrolimus kikuchii]|uniref:Uncharacterized protein n=1 Tax=Dendrolimus kikuchii TaxID=765133 RepID=A0ACC1CTN9_9NEOP|nr:hypothetical protein K1T71_009760 [Dendrolimus kikuchii]
MQKAESSWRKEGDWKSRYTKLYSSRRISLPQEDTRRISFMSNDATPYTSLLMRMRASRQASSLCGYIIPSLQGISPTSSDENKFFETYFMRSTSLQSDNLGGNETLLLDMIRARSKEIQESQDQTLELPHEDMCDDQSSETCVHGLSMRMTERSISRSRSRVSRMSTRRDMDIPSILAFTTTTAPAPIPLEIPAFQKITNAPKEVIPRWSIRRAVCPVCSQKWKDRSSINNIKYSGLKRNSSSELPSIKASARLRTSITSSYVPRPALPMVDEKVGSLRNTSAAWQLTRARRFRLPKPQLPPPEATAPPSATAPFARKDLDLRVSRFLADASRKF